MPRLSSMIQTLESKLEHRLGRKWRKIVKKIRKHILLIMAAWYVLGMFINSIRLGIASTFPVPGQPAVKSIWVWNPISNILAIFTPHGIAVIFFCTVMILLITKKGYNILSGYKFERDPRGFDIIPDGTHGTGGWIRRVDMERILEVGSAKKLTGAILGKLPQDEDDDYDAEYITPKAGNQLNEHIMVFGATGSGKSRGFVKPFILQAARRKESLVLVDPKGELFESTSKYLEQQGYVVKAYNLLDMENSDGYNCIVDIEHDKTLVQTIAAIIIKNTSNSAERQDFWEKAEQNLLMAMLLYIADETDPVTGVTRSREDRSLGAIYRMLSCESFSELNKRFEILPPKHAARAPYGIFKLANYQILGNIAIGLGNRLSVFQNKHVDHITKYNDIDLELPGKKPCAYYCIISDNDSSLEFLSSMFFSLLFYKLSNYARRNGTNGRLPVPVNVCLDEFCNIGQLLDFKKIISTVRSRGINCQIIIQSAAQLSDRYPHNEWEELIGSCDYQLFLGCNDQMTAKYISEQCGKVTIRVNTNQMPLQPLFSPVYNSTRPYSQSRANTQRLLMMPDELLRLNTGHGIILIRGQKPLLLKKIIPDELPDFEKLIPVRVTDHIPAWREIEAQREAELIHPSVQIKPQINEISKENVAPKTRIKAATPAKKQVDGQTALFSLEDAARQDIPIDQLVARHHNQTASLPRDKCDEEERRDSELPPPSEQRSETPEKDNASSISEQRPNFRTTSSKDIITLPR